MSKSLLEIEHFLDDSDVVEVNVWHPKLIYTKPFSWKQS